MGIWDIDVPPIPGKEGTYDYDDGNLIYRVKGEKTGIIVGSYIPPKRKIIDNNLEDIEDYIKRVTADINSVIDEIEESKDHVDAKARKHSIDSVYELGDTGLTFGQALKKATDLFMEKKGEISEKDITIPGIIVKSTKAGIEEINKDLVGDLEKGFNLGDFFGKYGPALNEAIWAFGYGYGQNGITNKHLLYMVYLVKKYNILNAIAGEIMELTMVKGIYLLYEAVLISKPDITDKDKFLQKVKKFTETAGKETMDFFRAIQGLFWIFTSGTVSDFIFEKIDKNIFEPLDKSIMYLLGITGAKDETTTENKNEWSKRQNINKEYTESFEEIYNAFYQEIDQTIKNALENAKDIKVDLSEVFEGTFQEFVEKLVGRFNLISKLFGADKAYTVYNMRNIGDSGIKFIKEENIDGPGLVYGSKVVITQGGVNWANVNFFGKFKDRMKSKIGQYSEGTDISGIFSNLALHNKAGNFVTTKTTQAGVLAAELSFLRKKIVFTEERETEFKGLNRLHGDIDDISIMVQNMFDNGLEINNIPDFIAYCCEEGKKDLKGYIRELEGNRSNKSSLVTPKREKYFLIYYKAEKENKNGEKEKREISIGYLTDYNKERVEYVEKVKGKLTEIYERTDKIYLTNKNIILMANSKVGTMIDCDIFKVEKIALKDVAEKKGVVSIEEKRGRLKTGQSYIGEFLTVEEVRKYNREQHRGAYPLEISPEGDYLILYFASSGITSSANILARFILGKSSNEITDVKFPAEKYEANNDYLYGSANKEDRPEGTQEAFEFWVGTGNRKHYAKKDENQRETALEKYQALLSNPESKILINGKEIGENLIRKAEWENFADYIQKQHEYEEIINFENGKILEIQYIYDMNGGWIFFTENTRFPYLKIKYRYVDKNIDKGDNFNEWNNIIIREFADLDYGIDIPEIGDSLSGSRFNNYFKKESKLERVDTKEVTSKGKGKIIINGKYVTAVNLTKIETDKSRKKYKISDNETLWDIASEHYKGDGNRWTMLEKEDGSNFTEEEAENMQVGTIIYIPLE